MSEKFQFLIEIMKIPKNMFFEGFSDFQRKQKNLPLLLFYIKLENIMSKLIKKKKNLKSINSAVTNKSSKDRNLVFFVENHQNKYRNFRVLDI